MSDSHDQHLTWAMLLAKWTDFAKAAVALPAAGEGEGPRWRACVPSVIALQAVTHAIGDIDAAIDEADRALSLDKAAVLITQHAAEIHTAWRGEPMPEGLVSIIDEARAAHRVSTRAGWLWLVTDDVLEARHPGEIALAIAGSGFEGDIYLPGPGIPIFHQSPAAIVRCPGETDDEILALIGAFLGDAATGPVRSPGYQAYRQFDFIKGGALRDLVTPLDAEPQAGQPLLVPVILGGVVQPVSLPPKRGGPIAPIPVEWDAEPA